MTSCVRLFSAGHCRRAYRASLSPPLPPSVAAICLSLLVFVVLDRMKEAVVVT